MTVSPLKNVTISQLKVGVFVAKLDISWLDSPFLGNKRLIKNQSEIDKLRAAGAVNVIIDVSKGLDVDEESKLAEAIKSTPIDEAPPEIPSDKKAPTVQQEMGAALLIRKQINQTIERLQQAIKNESTLDARELNTLVDHTLESLTRNDQALMSLVHISRKTQKLADHTFGAFCLTLNLAIARGFSGDEREQLGLAALFHEAGWTGLPLNLMGKRTKYTKNELSLVERHPLISQNTLKKFQLPELTMRIIAEHHERLDGSGYPRQLKAGDIHPLTQLFSVVDAYEERVHQLQDQPGMIPTNALKSLYTDAEKGKFNPEVVASFINLLGIYPPTTAVLLNTGEKAVVKEVCINKPLLPIIAIYYDRTGLAHLDPVVVDLRDQSATAIHRVITGALDLSLPESDPAKCLSMTDSDIG